MRELADASLSFNSIAQWDEAGYLDKLIALTRTVWRDRAYGDMWSYMLLAEGLHRHRGRVRREAVRHGGARAHRARRPAAASPRSTGEPGPWHGSALASNGLLHDAVLDALR